jgi:hypothetical protein
MQPVNSMAKAVLELRNCLLFFLGFISLTWISEAGPQPKVKPSEPAKQTGTIIVYRPWHFSGAAVSAPFMVDHGQKIKLENGYYYRIEVAAGDHIISHPGGIIMGEDPQVVHVLPGSAVYFACFYNGVGRVFEVAEDQAEAAQRCGGLKAQNQRIA